MRRWSINHTWISSRRLLSNGLSDDDLPCALLGRCELAAGLKLLVIDVVGRLIVAGAGVCVRQSANLWWIDRPDVINYLHRLESQAARSFLQSNRVDLMAMLLDVEDSTQTAEGAALQLGCHRVHVEIRVFCNFFHCLAFPLIIDVVERLLVWTHHPRVFLDLLNLQAKLPTRIQHFWDQIFENCKRKNSISFLSLAIDQLTKRSWAHKTLMLHCLYAAFRFVQKQLTTLLIANGFFHSDLERQASHNHGEQNDASEIRLRREQWEIKRG